MVSEKDAAGEVLPKLSLTVTVNEEVPVPLGFPLITPVEALSERPAGSDPLNTVQLL